MSRLDTLTAQARAAKSIAVHLDEKGGVFCSMGAGRIALHDADEIEAVMRVVIERLHDPAAPKDKR